MALTHRRRSYGNFLIAVQQILERDYPGIYLRHFSEDYLYHWYDEGLSADQTVAQGLGAPMAQKEKHA